MDEVIINKVLNANSIISEFHDILNEERGYSEEVDRIGNEISKFLKKIVSENKPIIYKDDEIETIEVNFKRNIFNENINFNIYVYYFKSLNDYYNKKNRLDIKYGYIRETKTVLVCICVAKNTIIFNSFTPKIVHEIRHDYQYAKSGALDLKTRQYKKIKNINKKERFKQDIWNVGYYSQKHEQEAYGQELYTELIRFAPKPYYMVLDQCNAYLNYKEFEKSIQNIENYKNNHDLINIIGELGYDIDNFIKKAKIAQDEFLHKLGRIISLYEDNKYKDNNGDFDPYID